MGFEDVPDMMDNIMEVTFKQEDLKIVTSGMTANAVMIQQRADALGSEEYIKYIIDSYFDKNYEKGSDLSYLYHKGDTLTFMCKPERKEFYIKDTENNWRPIKPNHLELMIILVMEGESK